MKHEIERKFLVKTMEWMNIPHTAYDVCQFYFSNNIRIRLVTHSNGDKVASITIKMDGPSLMARCEWEFDIPYGEAMEVVAEANSQGLGLGSVRKTRHLIPYDSRLMWEIDVFCGDNEGLVMAEIELPSTDFDLKLNPMLFGKEVTDDSRYKNAFLANNPYSEWFHESER